MFCFPIPPGKSLTVVYILGLLFILSESVQAAVPQPLPVPDNFPPCAVTTLPEQVPFEFPCGLILLSESDTDPVADAGARAGAQLRFRYGFANAAAVVVNDPVTLQRLAAESGVQLIPDRLVLAPPPGKGKPGGEAPQGQVIPSGIERIGAGPGSLGVAGGGVGVAVVDSGIDSAHADLIEGEICFDAFGSDCGDRYGHGTHVAGIVAALDNDIDVVGVAPLARPYAVRVLNESGKGSDATILAGLEWVLNNADQAAIPIRVVNMSLGRSGEVGDNPVLHAAIQALVQSGITVVVAAGNDPAADVTQMIPAAYAEVLSVASTTAKAGENKCRRYSGVVGPDVASIFTTDGAGVVISAPGEQKEDITRACRLNAVGILSLAAGGGTARMFGTSMAAPHVTGVVALLYSSGQFADPGAIRSAITGGAARIGNAPLDSPASAYTFDGVREGVLSAPGALFMVP